MDALTQIVKDINSILWGPWCLIPILVGTGIFFTFKLRAVQIRHFKLAFKHVFGGLSFNGEKAGHITSGCVSPSTGKNIALAYVKNIKEICTDAVVQVMIREKLHDARVVKRPFVQKRNRVK